MKEKEEITKEKLRQEWLKAHSQPSSVVAPALSSDTIKEKDQDGTEKKIETARPMLTDPQEFETIRKIYFGPITPKSTRDPEVDSTELWDRMLHKKNRNQTR